MQSGQFLGALRFLCQGIKSPWYCLLTPEMLSLPPLPIMYQNKYFWFYIKPFCMLKYLIFLCALSQKS